MNPPAIVTQLDILDTYTFALADRSQEDMEILKRMTQELAVKVKTIKGFVDSTPFIFFNEKNNRLQRMIVYNYKQLLAKKSFWFVGFMGYKKKNTKLNEKVGKIDWEISQSLVGNDELLSYSSQSLADGNWFNFVVFDKALSKKHVIKNEKHKYAAHVLAPKHFLWVRLHNGIFHNGIQDIENITLQSTKYYYFENSNSWFGKREYMVQ